jgi:exodeoxyribonuclease VII small subunit
MGVNKQQDDNFAESNAAGEISELGFEDAYAALEQAVTELEDGEQSLDQALELYGRGVALAERCNALLASAELHIRQIDEAGQDAGPLEL